MPQVMRSQRLVELALLKRCAWMPGAHLYAPPVTPPR
jgi:hypothetical protein